MRIVVHWLLNAVAILIAALLVLLVSALVPGFEVDGFLWAVIFSLVLAVLNAVLHKVEEGM